MGSSDWVAEHLGEAAEGLRDAVLTAVPSAHDDAVGAQAVSGTNRRDPYGHTLKVRQHEWLIAAGRDVPGVEVFHPHGASFDLLRVASTGTLLFPWRYATSTHQHRADARMRTSEFRMGLLSGGGGSSGQLTLDHAAMSGDELEVQLEQDRALEVELRRIAPVVIIGFASSSTGLFDLGWGPAELIDDSGVVRWTPWEPLQPPTVVGSARRGGPRSIPSSPTQTTVSPTVRFDAAGSDEIELTHRSLPTNTPDSEPVTQAPEADGRDQS